MTVSSTAPPTRYDGDGTTTAFATEFRFLENAHVQVFLRKADNSETQWVENTQYTLTGADLAAGGTVTVKTTPTNYTPQTGETLVILRKVPENQETDYVENDPFPAETHERALDKLTMIDQDQTERLDRTPQLPATDSQIGSSILPIDSERAGKFAAWDSNGGWIASPGTVGQSPIAVSAYMEIVLGSLDASAARGNLVAQKDLSVLPGAEGDVAVRKTAMAAWAPPASIGITGEVRSYLGATAPAGWLLLEGGTIGNAASGASARANADTNALFVLLWDSMADAQAPVLPGPRGASAQADFDANKTIGLPDGRGRAPIGTGQGATLTNRTHGDSGGAETHTLTVGEMPTITPTIPAKFADNAGSGAVIVGGPPDTTQNANSFGNDQPHNNMQPWLALRFMVKL